MVAGPLNAADGAYVFDDKSRAQVDGNSTDMKGAIAAMRGVLLQPGGVVRLIGGSGMGKTRLAETLLDER